MKDLAAADGAPVPVMNVVSATGGDGDAQLQKSVSIGETKETEIEDEDHEEFALEVQSVIQEVTRESAAQSSA